MGRTTCPSQRRQTSCEPRSFAERQPIDLDAQYRVQGPPLWLRCRVVDISTHGAGLLLVDEVTDPMRTVVIELRPPGRTERIVLNAVVRRSSLTDGLRRIGVEFLDVGTFDELALCELIARHADYPSRHGSRRSQACISPSGPARSTRRE